jgi:hypothetical protein
LYWHAKERKKEKKKKIKWGDFGKFREHTRGRRRISQSLKGEPN